MRIGYVITGLTRGGAEQQLVNLVTNLTEHEAFVICYVDGPHRQTLEEYGVPVHVVHVPGKISFMRAVRETKRIIEREKPDLVHSFLPHANIITKLLRLFSKLDFRLVCSIRVKEIRYIFQNLAERLLDAAADATTVNSQVLKAFLTRRLLFRSRKIHVIYNGFSLRQAQARRVSKKKTILTVAQFRAQKDYATNIRACERLLERRSDFVFAYVGDGALMERMRRRVRRRGLDEHIMFLGCRADVAELMRGSEVFFLPTRYEGQSNALIEAMYYKCPIVTTDIAENRELVKEHAMLVEPGHAASMAQAIERLLDDRKLAQRLSRGAHERSTGFSVNSMVAAYKEVYARYVRDCRHNMGR